MTNIYGVVARLTALALAVVVLVGCHRGEGTAGGPGAAAPGDKPPLYGQADDTFNLTTSSVSLKQGDAEKGAIGIKRGTNFDQDVTLAFADVPKGVTLDPASPVLKSADADAKFTLTASDAAVPGEYKVKVVGHPAGVATRPTTSSSRSPRRTHSL
jgi:hypothetical protein